MADNNKQKIQGGSGGSASSANPSGVRKSIEYKPPASSRVNMDAANHFEGPPSLLEKTTNTIGGAINQAVTPSNYLGVAKGGLKQIGSGIAGVTAGIANMATSDGSMRSTPKYTSENVFNGITSPISDLYNKAVSYSSRGMESIFGNKPLEVTKTPSVLKGNPTVLPETVVEGSKDNAKVQPSPTMTVPTQQEVFRKTVDDRVESGNFAESKPSYFYREKRMLDGTKGSERVETPGGVRYVQDDSGNILRQDSKGITKLADSITHNNLSKEEENSAVERSNQMVADYYRNKEKKQLSSFINSELINPTMDTRRLGAAVSRLQDIEAGETNKYTADLTSKNSFDKNRIDARSKSQEEAREQDKLTLKQKELALQQGNKAADLLFEGEKDIHSSASTLGALKAANALTPSVVRGLYSSKIGKLDDGQTLEGRLKELIDSGDITEEESPYILQAFR